MGNTEGKRFGFRQMVRMVVEEGFPAHVTQTLDSKTEGLKQKATTIFDGESPHNYTDEEIARRGTEFIPTLMIDIDRRREANKDRSDQE